MEEVDIEEVMATEEGKVDTEVEGEATEVAIEEVVGITKEVGVEFREEITTENQLEN